jgi:hypothetical protein
MAVTDAGHGNKHFVNSFSAEPARSLAPPPPAGPKDDRVPRLIDYAIFFTNNQCFSAKLTNAEIQEIGFSGN